jgi:hypothetical protein
MVAARLRSRPASQAVQAAAIVAPHEPTRHHPRSAARRLRRLPARQLSGRSLDLAHAGGHRPGRDLPGAAATVAADPPAAPTASGTSTCSSSATSITTTLAAHGCCSVTTTLGLSFGDIWFNAPPTPAAGAWPRASHWPTSWAPGTRRCPGTSRGLVSLCRRRPRGAGWSSPAPGLPKVTLLSPTPDRLADLYRVWAKELERLRLKERDRAEPAPPRPGAKCPTSRHWPAA